MTAYLAAEGFVAELQHELGDDVLETHDRLVITRGAPRDVAWAQNVWLDPVRMPIASVGDAAKKLRAIQRNWTLMSVAHHRRAALIASELPPIKARTIDPFSPLPTAPLGAFTLLAPDEMLASARCSSPFPNGELHFNEDRVGPPSRAYLKLWDAFTRFGVWPKAGERCIDAGSSPGGWTWVLQKLGASVLSVDKADLAPSVASLPNVEHRTASAFSLDPQRDGPVDWFFSDVICYPARLLELVSKWQGSATRFVCTLKFQGETDHDVARAFAAIPGGRVVHLFHNKHELTFLKL